MAHPPPFGGNHLVRPLGAKAAVETSQYYEDANSQNGEFRRRFIHFRVYHITIRLVVGAKRNEDKGLEAPPAKDNDS